MGYGGAWVGEHEFGLTNEISPCHVVAPPHARAETHAKGVTPKPKPPGWWLRRFLPTHAPTQAPYPTALALDTPTHLLNSRF
ncbi:hypothetical protein Hanom_Chr13g01239661 [Helianthus anomalus]